MRCSSTAGDALGEITRRLARWASQSILPAKGPSTLSAKPLACLAEPPALPCVTTHNRTHTQGLPAIARAPQQYHLHIRTSASHLPAAAALQPAHLPNSKDLRSNARPRIIPESTPKGAEHIRVLQQACRRRTGTFTTSVAIPAAYMRHCQYAICSWSRRQEEAMGSGDVIWRALP